MSLKILIWRISISQFSQSSLKYLELSENSIVFLIGILVSKSKKTAESLVKSVAAVSTKTQLKTFQNVYYLL